MKQKRKNNPDRNPTRKQGPIREPDRLEEMVLERGKGAKKQSGRELGSLGGFASGHGQGDGPVNEEPLRATEEDPIFSEGGSDEDLSESGERPDLWTDDLKRKQRGKSGVNWRKSRASPEKRA